MSDRVQHGMLVLKLINCSSVRCALLFKKLFIKSLQNSIANLSARSTDDILLICATHDIFFIRMLFFLHTPPSWWSFSEEINMVL